MTTMGPADVPNVMQWEPLADIYTARWDVDLRLVMCVVMVESRGDPYAVSFAGAAGLMGTMARDAPGNPRMFADRPTIRELQNPAIALNLGCAQLHDSLDFFGGDVRRGLLGYYVGPTGAERCGVTCDDGRVYLERIEEAWRLLYPGQPLPWERKVRRGEIE